MPKVLSFRDKQSLVAAALGIRGYMISDMFDSSVIYTTDWDSPTYQASYGIVDGVVTVGDPEEVVGYTVYEPVVKPAQFSMDEGEVLFSDELVTWKGKVFEVGDYPDKEFSITADEADAAIAAFSPVRNDLEHTSTILDGKIGNLSKVWRDGDKSIFGEIAIPKWLHETQDGKPIKVSLTWDRRHKKIVGCALTLNPRVSDAQVEAAFSAASTPTKEVKSMSYFEKLLAKMGKKPEEATEADFKQAIQEETPLASAPTEPAASAAFSALEAENNGLRAAALRGAGETFFSEILAAKKAFPAQREFIIAQYAQAVQDDNAGKACFSGEGKAIEGSRVAQLRATFAAAPSHNLTDEQVPADAVLTLSPTRSDDAKTVTMSDDRKSELLSHTETAAKK